MASHTTTAGTWVPSWPSTRRRLRRWARRWKARTRGWPRRWGRRLTIVLIVFAIIVGVGYGAAQLADEPLRKYMQATINSSLQGYTAHIADLDFRPWDFGITLQGLQLTQDAHPNPPMMAIDAFKVGLHWRALLHLALVADVTLDAPRVRIDLAQFQHEADDKTPVSDKGWQDAVERIYPLKINEFVINNGAVTYVDPAAASPVNITDLNIVATNIRNVASPDRTYPSRFHLDAVLFGQGHVAVKGRANFLAEPQPGFRAHLDVKDVPLQRLRPVAMHANVYVSDGTVDATGKFEYGSTVQHFEFQRVTVNKLALDYTHAPQTAAAEAQRAEDVKQGAQQAANAPKLVLLLDDLEMRNSMVGFVDKTANPSFRVFMNDIDMEIRNFSNQADAGKAGLTLHGQFMGSGDTELKASFLPESKQPEFNVALKVVDTQLTSLNDLLRNYGDFDVTAGTFSLYTQVQVANGKIDGYVKPLFDDMNVYDRRQDKTKPIFQQLYEAAAGGVQTLLQNPHRTVATQANVSGKLANPDIGTLQLILNLLRNAFIQSILPGFQHAVRAKIGGA
jgi:hypothetical protein